MFSELSNPSIPHIKPRIETLCETGVFSTIEIVAGTPEYELFHGLAIKPPKGQVIIGKGEVATLNNGRYLK